MKICLFGGSFDPVHAGHLAIATAAREACGLDRVVFLPAACSPFKEKSHVLFSDEKRLEMLNAAVRDLPWAEVSDLDLRLPRPSWSWRLVEEYRKEYPDEELFWLLGVDQWNLLHLWARPDYLAEQLTFIVCPRGGVTPLPRPDVAAVFLDVPEHPASSSAIRDSMGDGASVPQGWLSPAVEECLGMPGGK